MYTFEDFINNILDLLQFYPDSHHQVWEKRNKILIWISDKPFYLSLEYLAYVHLRIGMLFQHFSNYIIALIGILFFIM